MPLKSTSAFGRWEKAVWPVRRLFLPARTRWFVEGHSKLDGQLWLADRKLLYETVRARRPRTCFEIGTWKGGGSTLFIAQALCDSGGGVLHTIEIDPELAANARHGYESYLPHLMPFVRFHTGDYRQEYRECVEGTDPRRDQESGIRDQESGARDQGSGIRGSVDFVFLDGAEDGRETLAQFEFFRPHMQAGSCLVVHDWLTEKARLVREVLERASEWRIEKVLLPPRSVGCALVVRVTSR